MNTLFRISLFFVFTILSWAKGSGSGGSSSSSSGSVHVSGYTRANGTQVSAYDRSYPGSSRSSTTSSSSPTGDLSLSGDAGPGYAAAVNTNAQVYLDHAAYDKDGKSTIWHPKIQDFQTATYYKSFGYNFDPEKMSAEQMHTRVAAMDRAKYWKAQGIAFDPEKMTPEQMDTKAIDFEAAEKWHAKGLEFDPNTMTADEMRVEAKKLKKKKKTP